MTRSGRIAASCPAFLAVLAMSAVAVAQERSPLSASPAAVTLDAEGGGTVALSNELGTELSLDASVVGKDGERAAGATVTPPAGGTLAPGATGTVTVSVPAGAEDSSLVVVVEPAEGLPGGAVVRVPLARAEAVKPAVAKWTLWSVHAGEDGGTRLPLTGPCSGLELDKPKELGTVQADGRQLTVTGSCASAADKALTLDVTDIKSDGREYSGTIKLGEDAVELTVQDTLSWAIAALLVGFGIGVALWRSDWGGTGRAAAEVRRNTFFVEDLVAESNPANADRSFASAAAKLDLPPNVRQWTIAAAVRAKLADLRKALRRAEDEDEIEAVQQDLDALELEVRDWPKVANSLGDLEQRAPRLGRLTTYAQEARKLTLDRQGPLDLDAMRAVKEKADEAVALASDWPSASIETAAGMAGALPDDHPAVASLDTVLERFDQASTAAAAREAVEAFWDAYAEVRQAEAAKKRGFVEATMPEAGDVGWTGFSVPVGTDDPAATARRLSLSIWALDLSLLLVLLAAALVGGMQALWVGKSFGGFWDIAAALLWGLGAGAVGAPLSAALGNLGRSWIDARGGG